MKKSKAYYLMDAAAVVSTMVDKTKITSERQARELARVEPARREEVTMGPTGPKDVARLERVTAGSVGDGQTCFAQRLKTSPSASSATSGDCWRFVLTSPCFCSHFFHPLKRKTLANSLSKRCFR